MALVLDLVVLLQAKLYIPG